MIHLLLALAVIGFLVWALVTYVPMPDLFKRAIIVIVVILVVLWILSLLGVGDVPLTRLR
jgi:hypothetical protein